MEEFDYRILITKDPENEKFIGRAPELSDCQAEGASRSEALEALMERIRERVEEIREQGEEPPQAIESKSYDGEITAKVSPALQKELEWQSTAEEIPQDQLIGELLAEGLAQRWLLRRGGGRASEGRRGGGDRRRRGKRGERVNKSRYMNIMEDRASFIEYVRGLESGGGGGQGSRGGGGGRRGGGGGRRR
jgi:predicted RNase H-like HicB family nuclease